MVAEGTAPLVAEGVTKRYGRVVALSNVSLSIPAGSLTALVGPNAAGKSTLIKTFLGFERANAGTVRVAGVDPIADRAEALGHLGYIPQTPALYRELTVADHLDLAARLRPGFDRAAAVERLSGPLLSGLNRTAAVRCRTRSLRLPTTSTMSAHACGRKASFKNSSFLTGRRWACAPRIPPRRGCLPPQRVVVPRRPSDRAAVSVVAAFLHHTNSGEEARYRTTCHGARRSLMGYVGSYLWTLRQAVGSRLLLAPGAQVLMVDERAGAYFQRRRDTELWEIPAGACEVGSSFRSTAVAEVLEETGLRIEESDLTPFASLSEPDLHVIEYPNGDVTHCFALCFVATRWLGEVQIDPGEVAEYGFFPLDSPPTPLHPPTAAVLTMYVAFKTTGRFQAR